jgi:hypothetical protein
MPACGGGPPPYHHIYTPVYVSVEQVIKGQITSSRLELRLIGGTVGNDRLAFNERPLLDGERAVLFVNVPDGWSIAGRYAIDSNGIATEDASPYRAVPLQQLLAEIAVIVGPPPSMPSSASATPVSQP